ncbi:hypothetical protein WN48_06718 [Eufriesea mexicana]|uniref:Uncharacterized protein n=1 Tax=Eufriesea mexicana TaxID=516756 RepID=A0A310SG96_9HYME|nr:hypothetical protein WN48_06718 [Eufriesea mexicana]
MANESIPRENDIILREQWKQRILRVMYCQQNVGHVFECGKQNSRRKLEVSIDESNKMDIIFENLQLSSCRNIKIVYLKKRKLTQKEERRIDNLKTELIAKEARGKAVNLITGDNSAVISKLYQVIVHKNEEEIFVCHICNNGLYSSREEQEAGREAQKIGEFMYRVDAISQENRKMAFRRWQKADLTVSTLRKAELSYPVLVNPQIRPVCRRECCQPLREPYHRHGNSGHWVEQPFKPYRNVSSSL